MVRNVSNWLPKEPRTFPLLQRLLAWQVECDWPWPVGTSPGHELVQLLLVLLVLSGDGVLGLLLHGLNEVLHVLEGIDLQQDKDTGSRLAWGPTAWEMPQACEPSPF